MGDINQQPDARAHVRTCEEWAEAKGYLPQFHSSVVRGFKGRPATQRKENPLYHEFAQAKALKGWPQGKELTEVEFDRAIAEGRRLPLR